MHVGAMLIQGRAASQAAALTESGVVEFQHLAWVLVCAVLVMLMQGGFLCLESGLVRTKNSINVAIKNLVDICICSIAFWLFGYAVMFGQDYHGLVGTSDWMYSTADRPMGAVAFFVFQMMFCGTATTIISGAVAERMRFQGYLVVTLVISTVVYPLFGHWVWAGADVGESLGWLNRQGFVDFAGASVVHSTGGWVALAAAIVIGPRIGRFSKGASLTIRGHNLPMASLGALMLWVGWLGFNGGSTLALEARTPVILLNTCLAGAVGGVTMMAITWFKTRQPAVEQVINGVISGLVGVTASCHVVSPAFAAVIGMTAAVVCFLATGILDRLGVDDVIGAVPAHACAGAWGTLAVALFADVGLLGTGLDRWGQLEIQALGVVVCFAWSFGVGFGLLWVINKLVPLRVSVEAEYVGLNMAEHGASTAILDLFSDMEEQRRSGDFSRRVAVEPHTEVGQIALQYNRVLEKVNEDTDMLVKAYDEIRQMNLNLRNARGQEVATRDELQAKLEELQAFNKSAVGRELRMIELKREVNQLLGTLGKDPQYDLSFDDPDQSTADGALAPTDADTVAPLDTGSKG